MYYQNINKSCKELGHKQQHNTKFGDTKLYYKIIYIYKYVKSVMQEGHMIDDAISCRSQDLVMTIPYVARQATVWQQPLHNVTYFIPARRRSPLTVWLYGQHYYTAVVDALNGV